MEVQTAHGDADSIGDHVCQAAQDLSADLIALASHKKGAVKKALLGSVSIRCLKHSSGPVLVIKGT